ncbi:hypothetical protein L3V82_04605 [Thiotrichales bacterium 19S3-7]|nr:hypothetical protein [Thiotrichales bacterium 19S3-7]MCF6801377.1 hypothetical protein [Thiotrichales bacterium 19S3-11]
MKLTQWSSKEDRDSEFRCAKKYFRTSRSNFVKGSTIDCNHDFISGNDDDIYVLGDELGRGQFGVVRYAETDNKSPYAIKILQEDSQGLVEEEVKKESLIICDLNMGKEYIANTV